MFHLEPLQQLGLKLGATLQQAWTARRLQHGKKLVVYSYEKEDITGPKKVRIGYYIYFKRYIGEETRRNIPKCYP